MLRASGALDVESFELVAGVGSDRAKSKTYDSRRSVELSGSEDPTGRPCESTFSSREARARGIFPPLRRGR